MKDEPATHDFGPGRRCWGHDYTISKVLDGGQKVCASGWGHSGKVIREGDYLLLEAKGGQRATRYRVEKIRHLMDPADMWHADLYFAPRTYATQAEKDASR
ncbi:hypothetical protein ACWERY_02090 [Streptomyces sp. NPDC004082]